MIAIRTLLAAAFFFPRSASMAVADHDETLAGRWSSDRAKEWYAKQPWLVGCNFIPSTAINQLEMWQAGSFDPNTIDRELGWAAGLGMNTVRVYLDDLLWQQDGEGFLKRMDQFLGIADKHGIKPMFVLFDSCWNPFPKLGKQPDPKPHVHNSGWLQAPHIDILKDVTKHESLKPYVNGVIGRFKDAYNWGLVAGKIQTQYPWSSWQTKFTAEPEVWHHDILRPDGTPHIKAEADLIKSLTGAGSAPQSIKTP